MPAPASDTQDTGSITVALTDDVKEILQRVTAVEEHLKGINGQMTEAKEAALQAMGQARATVLLCQQSRETCQAEVYSRITKLEVARAIVFAVPPIVVLAVGAVWALLKMLGKL